MADEEYNPGTELDTLLRERPDGRSRWNFCVHEGDIYVMGAGAEQLVKLIEVGNDDWARRILKSRGIVRILNGV